MLKFIHKNHIHKDPKTKSLVVYYNMSDIVLGFLLIVLVSFFIYSYLEFSFKIPDNKEVSLLPGLHAQYPAGLNSKSKH